MVKRLLIAGLLVLFAAGYYVVRYQLPDRHDPFAPLLIEQPPGLATALKLKRIKTNSELCFSVLSNSDLRYVPLTDRETGAGCGLFNAVSLQQSGISYGGDINLTCPALVALAIWERHTLQPLAQASFDQEIIRVRHFGTYACRNVNNARSGRRSQHALANAIDIAGFVLADGAEINIAKDWRKDSAKARFLQTLHAQSCNYFSAVLGPDYNAQHYNHFHMDLGPYSICR